MSLTRTGPKVNNFISKIKGIKLDEIFGNTRLSGSRQRKTKLQMDVSKISKKKLNYQTHSL